MAKIAFSKLGLKPNNKVAIININEATVEVKEYLPTNIKLELISNVINNTADDNGYYNWGKLQVYFAIEVITYYTNISFTEKQKEDVCKLFDLFNGNEAWEKIWDILPASEKEFLTSCLYKSIESIYAYRNSVMGIMENISADYSNLEFDAKAIQQAIGDTNNLGLLREVLTKLG